MSKRAKIILIVIVLLVVVYLIWLLGDIAREKKATENQVYYENLLAEDAKLKDLVNTNLRIKGVLLDISEATTTQTYNPNHLKLVETENELIIREYGKNLSQILKPISETRDNEVLLVLDALKNPDPDQISKLNKIKTNLDQVVKELLILPIPKDAQVVHLRLINTLTRMSNDLKNMSQVLEEPKLALEASNKYVEDMVLFFKRIEGINVYFTKQGIIFSEDENITIYDSLGIVQ